MITNIAKNHENKSILSETTLPPSINLAEILIHTLITAPKEPVKKLTVPHGS